MGKRGEELRKTGLSALPRLAQALVVFERAGRAAVCGFVGGTYSSHFHLVLHKHKNLFSSTSTTTTYATFLSIVDIDYLALASRRR